MSCLTTLTSVLFDYDTPKIVNIKNKTVGVINRLVQLTVIGYIIGYVIVYEKGYQTFQDVQSVTMTKMKGVSYTNITGVPDLNVDDPSPYNRIWDVADYVIPPQEHNVFFVMTNMIITADQTQDKCAEDPGMLDVLCEKDSDCPANTPVINGNGVRTGVCANYSNEGNVTIKTCEIYAWCPVEKDELPRTNLPVLEGAANFTVLIKNTIEFPRFKFSKRNILESFNSTYLKGCHFNARDSVDRFCPIFRLGTMVEEAGESFNSIAKEGGVIGIVITWNCNLDHSADSCIPKYSFRRLDNKKAKIAGGYNFRFSDEYKIGETEYRTLTKAYGIQFELVVNGRGGKFDIVPLILNLASGLALLTIASVLSDILVLYIVKKRQYYKEKKYLRVQDSDSDIDDEEVQEPLMNGDRKF